MLKLRNQIQGRPNHRRSRRSARGLSIVELMVGMAIGLFLLVGASSMLISSITNSRALLAEARVNQNLRSAADLITRDLRRAGYWENAMAGTTTTGSAATANPNSAISTGSSTVTYSLARDASAVRITEAEKNTLNLDEQFGFKLEDGVVEMLVGSGNWQKLTDPGVLSVTDFDILGTTVPIDIKESCAKTCCDSTTTPSCTSINVATPPGCPKISVRRYDLSLTGQSATDSAVVRTLKTSVRVRNDAISGACPN